MKTILFFLLISFCLVNAAELETLNLMPVPESVQLQRGKFILTNDLKISIENYNGKRLDKAAARFMHRLGGRTGMFFSQDFHLDKSKISGANLLIDVKREGKLELGENESYQLSVTENKIKLTAETDLGALHGLETLLQLLDADTSYYFPAVEITDQPRFQWRGLLIDVCRHFQPVEVIKRNLDAMAAVKMNVFHWHLTEDQGFRVECKTYPKLHEMGSDGNYFTHEQIKDIVDYAADRGIRVMPEFDLPGHATTWLVAYPELASAPGPYNIERNWGIFDPTFDPTNDETYKFLEAFFKEMATLFPDAYWHIGGDENKGHQWDANAKIQEFMKKNDLKDNHDLQNYFNLKLEKILDKLGKTMVGWYTDKQPVLSKKYIIQSWKGRESLYESARNGYRCLLSHGFYIDLIQPTSYHYANDPIPPDSILRDEVKKRILGGEATMWAEFVGPETIDSRIWPRTAAIAERLWSPGHINDMDDLFRRLDVTSFRFEELGLTHIKNYDMMLRRLANNTNIDALKNFVNVIEPLYTYSRDHPHVFKSYYPLTRVVDAAQPDPPVVREFDSLVKDYLADKTNSGDKLKAIVGWLKLWKANHELLNVTIKKSPVLNEIATLSEDLAKCAGIGLEALNYIKTNENPDAGWIEEKLETLKQARVPSGETELLIVDSIESLVKAIQQ